MERQRRLAAVAAAIAARHPLDDVLLLIRDAIADVGGFDRAGIHLYCARRDVLECSWGTDRTGRTEDLRGRELPVLHQPDSPVYKVVRLHAPYAVIDDMTGSLGLKPGHAMYGVRHNAVVGLRAAGELVGIVGVDNLITGRPIAETDLETLLPLAEQAAVAIHTSRLLSQQDLQVERQRRMAKVAAAIAAQTDLREVLRLIRSALVEAVGFDRAGIWLYDPERGMAQGAWGTDRSGREEDLSWDIFEVDPQCPYPMHAILRGELDYYRVDDFTADAKPTPDDPMFGVHAQVVTGLKVGGTVLGEIAVDNALSDAPITDADLEMLLLFADQAAVAIQNARLLERVRSHSAALQQQVDERTADLAAANEELASFAYTVAHDLRSPLRAIDGFAHLVLSVQGAVLTPESVGDLERIREAGQQMGRLIDDLLEFTRTGRRKLHRLRVDVAEVVDRAWARLVNDRAGRRIDLVVNDLPNCEADPVLLEDVFVRLLSNALKFTRQRPDARIEVGCSDGGAYYVSDNGVGFEQAYADTLFDVFRRLDRSEDVEGTGAGLAFVKRIVQRHGGRKWAEGTPGEGATFSFRLIEDDEQRPETSTSPPASGPSSCGTR